MHWKKSNMFSNKIIINYYIILLLCCGIRSKSIDLEDKLLPAPSPKLLIVSYDGFRNEYFNRNITDYLNNLRLTGTYTDFMTNVFPTKTFPNHQTIATGLYADKHGVTGNSVYDHRLKHLLNLTELFDYDSDHVTPIWILNQKSGPNRFSGCMMWPGIENTYQNESCHFKTSYRSNMSFYDRVDQMMNWFTNKTTPINLGLLYFEEPDNSAHVYGPDSSQVNDEIRKVNNITEYIQWKLHDLGLSDVNVIYLSDHGMDTVLVRNIIDLNNFIKNDTYMYYGTSPVLQIVPNEPSELDSMYKALRIAAETNNNFKIYLNSELPVRWHIQNDQRVGPITVLANEGYGFHDLYVKLEQYQKKGLIPSGPVLNHTLGTHGYDNALTNMHAFFIAWGPNIQKNKRIPPFNTLELNGLFCKLLNIVPITTTILDNFVVAANMRIESIPYDEDNIHRHNDIIILGVAIIFLSLVLAGVGIRIFIMRCKFRDPHMQNVSDNEKVSENQHLMVVNFSETED